MSAHSIPSTRVANSSAAAPSWLTSRPFWGGIAIVSMWLAVLFVGVFGGDILSSSPGGSSSSVPVVVVVAGVALIASWIVAVRAFTSAQPDEPTRRLLQEEREAREQLARELAEVRGRLSGQTPGA